MRNFDLWQTERNNPENEKFLDLNIQRIVEENRKPIARIWAGKALKPYAHYRFESVERMEKYIGIQKDNRKNKLERKEQEKREKAAAIKGYKLKIKVGDIYVSSWGYDQTNIDFYEILSVKGRSIIMQEIGKFIEPETCFMSNYCQPDRSSKIGEPFKKIVQLNYYDGKISEYINLASYKSCCPWDGRQCYETHYA